MLWIGVALTLVPLFYYKYVAFILRQLTQFDLINSVADDVSLLPVGLSFYTLQTVSYLVDVYRRHFKAEKNFIRFALYVAYFGQLVAGPIDRARDILPQFTQSGVVLTKSNFIIGFKIFMRGLVKKMVIADGVAALIPLAFSQPSQISWSLAVLTAVSLPIFVYNDFFGYSTMAIGISRIMGISIIDNFNRPFFAANYADFWRRWHVSFFTFLRDYVKQPLISLGLNRWLTLLTVWFVSSTWHGVNWTFYVWGISQFLSTLIDFRSNYKMVPSRIKLLQNWMTNFILFMIGMIIFFAPSISALMIFCQKLVSVPSAHLIKWPFETITVVVPFTLFIASQISASIQERQPEKFETDQFEIYDIFKLAVQFNLIFFFGNFGGHAFIYFNF